MTGCFSFDKDIFYRMPYDILPEKKVIYISLCRNVINKIQIMHMKDNYRKYVN